MESELSAFRAAQRAPQTTQPDANAIKRAYLSNPIGFLQSLGLNEAENLHVQRVHVANAMGDAAPTELKMLAQMGPQISATNTLQATVEALSRRLDEKEKRDTQQGVRSSFAALVADKSKYPHLSDAYKSDPALFEAEMSGFAGNASDLADQLEKRTAAIAKLYKPAGDPDTASTTAENTSNDGQSNEAKPAVGSALGGDPPAIKKASTAVFVPGGEEDKKLQQEVLRKFGLQK